jgi:predicted nucleic acid-binding protein
VFLIDTSAWIHAIRSSGDPAFSRRVRELLESEEAAWCDAVRLELWNGARGEQEAAILKEMEQIIPNLAITSDVWTRAVETVRRTRKVGITIPLVDHLIKACAHLHKVNLLHADKHFDLIPD